MKTRQEILAKLRAEVKSGNILVGGGAGTGISAKRFTEPLTHIS